MISLKRFRERKLTISDNFIFDEYNREVMGSWETEMMKTHVDHLNPTGKDVLEIGFGMGISPTFFVESNPKSYTIVECHPQILDKLYQWKEKYPDQNIIVIEGEWYEQRHQLQKYDCIFYDIFDDPNEKDFYENVDELLNDGGIMSFFGRVGRRTEGEFYGKKYTGTLIETTRTLKDGTTKPHSYVVPIYKKI
jgi:spermidine synthase